MYHMYGMYLNCRAIGFNSWRMPHWPRTTILPRGWTLRHSSFGDMRSASSLCPNWSLRSCAKSNRMVLPCACVAASPPVKCDCISKNYPPTMQQDIGHLVKIKGLVTRASDVKPQITVCTYTCETCGSELFQEVLIPYIHNTAVELTARTWPVSDYRPSIHAAANLLVWALRR